MTPKPPFPEDSGKENVIAFNPGCESCGRPADVVLDDGSWWCRLCDGSARRLGYDAPDLRVVE